MNVNVMMQYVTYGLALIGVLAFLVSIIVQVIKELPGLNKIPTSIVALVTSLILCPVALESCARIIRQLSPGIIFSHRLLRRL